MKPPDVLVFDNEPKENGNYIQVYTRKVNPCKLSVYQCVLPLVIHQANSVAVSPASTTNIHFIIGCIFLGLLLLLLVLLVLWAWKD